MGFIRKSLFVATMGGVAPNSKKQKTAKQTLAAVQGKSAAEVARTGTRRAALGSSRPKFSAAELAYMRAHTARPKP